MVKYAVYLLISILILGGTYLFGFNMGASNTKIEYVTKEVEVIRYVNAKKADIYSKPNANRSELLLLLHDGSF